MSLPGLSGARIGKATTATEKCGLLFNPRDGHRSQGQCWAARFTEGAPSKLPASNHVSERGFLLGKGSWITFRRNLPQAPSSLNHLSCIEAVPQTPGYVLAKFLAGQGSSQRDINRKLSLEKKPAPYNTVLTHFLRPPHHPR